MAVDACLPCVGAVEKHSIGRSRPKLAKWHKLTKCSSPSPLHAPTIAIAHDYLTQRGGAERVTLALATHLSRPPIYTSIYNPDSTFPGYRDFDIRTTWLQRVPIFRRDPRRALPFLLAAWRSVVPAEDIVIASSSGWAHAVRTRQGATKIVYCHNPPRWIYQPRDYCRSKLAGAVLAHAATFVSPRDAALANEADLYIANSTSVARRIGEAYGIDAPVIHPPTSLDSNGEQQEMPSIRPGYWITVGRGRGYKNTDVLVEAINATRTEQLVVVGSVQRNQSSSKQVTFVGRVSDAQLRWLYANARALISVSHEDFGLTPLEANSFGVPALVLRAGGFLDSLSEGVSGAWIEAPHRAAVLDGMRNFREYDSAAVKRHADMFSPGKFADRIRSIAIAHSGTANVAR